ncbi:MAG: DUF126 domain-containing protein [Ottowia sp.]|uniref:aconitase X swivel domain-containing protein n=1 Tax=unclassified Ottowia TaxID=2645081 RepID=UPI003C3049A9
MTRVAKRQLQGPPGYGLAVEGEAIVSRQGFNARYDLDRVRGVFSRPDHDHFGRSPAGKIYVFSTPKGGIATSWALLDLRTRGLAPLGLICRRANPVVAQGAVLSGIPLMDRLEEDPAEHIQTGDWIRLNPSLGLIEIF